MSSVLYDEPGPKTRRRILIGSAVAGVVVLAILWEAYQRLDANGQFEMDKWSPLFDPSTPEFPQVWSLLWEGAKRTLTAAFLAIVLSVAIGTLLAVSRVSATKFWRGPIVALIEVLRGVPVVIAIFFTSRVLPQYFAEPPTTTIGPITLDPGLYYVVIGLVIYNSVVIAEIIRAGINSLPKGQREASYAVGLTNGATLRLVLLPQAFRVMLPALISQLVVVLKDTSLGSFIGWSELLREGNLIIQTLRNPIQVYLLIAVLFIVINYCLGRLAQLVEKRLSRAHTSDKGPGPAPEAVADLEEVTGPQGMPARAGA